MPRAILFATLLMTVTGCTSQIVSLDTHVQSYVDSNIIDAQTLYLTPSRKALGLFETKIYAWQETQTKLDNGETQHAFSDPYRDCIITWVADSDGIIARGWYLGDDC